MMQASAYPSQPGMGPGHPGMAHGHPMQVQHGGHMGQPNPAMMGGMHPAMSGPQVTQGGPMASGMPPNPGTPAPGGPMQNAMAMAHLGGQAPMFHGNHQQLNMGQMQQMNANIIARQRAMNMMQAQNGQLGHGMMNMPGMNHGMNAQLQQMKAMNMPMQQIQHMTPQQQQIVQQQQQYQHQQRMMAQHAAAQQQMMSQQRQQAQQQVQQQHASQQMQMSQSQERTTQPPQPQSTPAPQAQPQTQAPPQPNVQAQQQTPQQKPQQPQPATTQPQQQNAPTPQIKQSEDEDTQTKPDMAKQQLLMEMAQHNQDFSGQCILQLLSYYDSLAYPQRPDIKYWQDVMAKYFSTQGSMRQQLFNTRLGHDKTFQLQYPSLARFYHSHFSNGVKKISMQSFEHAQEQMPNGGFHLFSNKLFVTYEFETGVKLTMQGTLNVTFDEMQKIELFHIQIKGWTEYVPRTLVEPPQSPEQIRQSPKLSKKNLPKNMQRPAPSLPRSPVSEWGLPRAVIQFLEIAEVMTTMSPLMEYYLQNQFSGPREALNRFNAETNQINASRMQNMNAAAANGQVQFANQRMIPPNQFQSPAFAHLNLPQNQQSPHMNATPSPGHNQGSVQMVHQMSAQGSNLSGSQGPSTNTSPNVSQKRRRASAIKEEDAAQAAGGDKTKPSPRVGKRQKGGPA